MFSSSQPAEHLQGALDDQHRPAAPVLAVDHRIVVQVKVIVLLHNTPAHCTACTAQSANI